MRSAYFAGLAKASLTSGSLYVLGDVINQKLIQAKPTLQTAQTAKFALIGATLHGPYFFHAFKLLDRVFGVSRSIAPVLVKSLSGQLFVFPPFVCAMLGYSAWLDNSDPRQRISSQFLPIFSNGFYCWPLANIITFKFVPVEARMVWINVVGIVWNSYLSWQIYGHQPIHFAPHHEPTGLNVEQ
ncbi:hypothetical protein HDV03_000661 [Kappamyces sp. JEL0829]|nr:hypothetical protein HDV03_000661 [Kappamyces sp. JEL0829]